MLRLYNIPDYYTIIGYEILNCGYSKSSLEYQIYTILTGRVAKRYLKKV